MVLPEFPWSLELGQHRQEPGFIKGLLEMQINTVTNVVSISCVSSSNSRRTSPSSSLPEGGRENQLKDVFVSSWLPLPSAPQGHWPQQQVHAWVSTASAMRQENRFFWEFKLKV